MFCIVPPGRAFISILSLYSLIIVENPPPAPYQTPPCAPVDQSKLIGSFCFFPSSSLLFDISSALLSLQAINNTEKVAITTLNKIFLILSPLRSKLDYLLLWHVYSQLLMFLMSPPHKDYSLY